MGVVYWAYCWRVEAAGDEWERYKELLKVDGSRNCDRQSASVVSRRIEEAGTAILLGCYAELVLTTSTILVTSVKSVCVTTIS